jgi:hypothetical protein
MSLVERLATALPHPHCAAEAQALLEELLAAERSWGDAEDARDARPLLNMCAWARQCYAAPFESGASGPALLDSMHRCACKAGAVHLPFRSHLPPRINGSAHRRHCRPAVSAATRNAGAALGPKLAFAPPPPGSSLR